MKLAKEIKKQAINLGFDDVGIAKVDDDQFEILDYIKANNFLAPLDYLENSIELRKNIRSIFPKSKSVIMVIKNYYTGDFPDELENKAKIARYAWGKDYHQWFKKNLKLLEDFLLSQLPENYKVWHFNDTKPVLERAWAQKAGLGFIGKSTMFISRKFGTWTLLGGLATDFLLEADSPYNGFHCGSCDRCLQACPTKAIIKPGILDGNKCIATWTIEKPLSEEAIEKSPTNHSWAFGCDICQEVCPWNKFEKVTNEERFMPIKGRVFLSEDTFRQDLRGSPLNRPRKAGLMANFLRIRKTLKEPNLKVINGNIFLP